MSKRDKSLSSPVKEFLTGEWILFAEERAADRTLISRHRINRMRLALCVRVAESPSALVRIIVHYSFIAPESTRVAAELMAWS